MQVVQHLESVADQRQWSTPGHIHCVCRTYNVVSCMCLQVVFTKPGVLLFASDKLDAKWGRLKQLAGEHSTAQQGEGGGAEWGGRGVCG